MVAAVDGVRARAVMRLPLVEARFWASRLVGGTGASSGEERLLTAVERALVWHLVDEHALELHLAFDGLLPTLLVEAFAYDRVRELAAPDDLMVQAGFALDRPGSRSVVTVTLPAEPILEALGHGTARQEQGLVTHRLERHVAAAPVDVALRFADTRVPAAVVLSLAEGDLIPLDHSAARAARDHDGRRARRPGRGRGERRPPRVRRRGRMRSRLVTFPSALSDVGTAGADDRAVETACANALVAALPGTALMAQRHGGAPVPPAELAAGVSATYVGAHSADFALILLDRTELLAAAGGDASRVRLGDVLRPALEQAASVIGGGMLGEATDGAPAALFQSPDAVVFDLVGEGGVAGWFAVQVRGAGAPRRVRATSRASSAASAAWR